MKEAKGMNLPGFAGAPTFARLAPVSDDIITPSEGWGASRRTSESRPKLRKRARYTDAPAPRRWV